MHRAAHVIPARAFIDCSADKVAKSASGLQRAMAINHMGRVKRKRPLTSKIVGVLGLLVLIAPPAIGQAVPRQLPPEPPPQLPSVNDYSLPPGEGQTPANDQAEGPAEENAPPPKAAPTPTAGTPSTQPITRPVPAAPLPQTDAAPTNRGQNRPAPLDSPRSSAPVSRVQPTPSTANSSSTPASDDPSINEGQPQPGFTTDMPGQALPSGPPVPGATPATTPSSAAPDSSSDGNFLYYIGGGIAFLLLGGLGIYFLRRKAATSLYEEEVPDDTEPLPTADQVPAPTPRKPAPKIYSPPNPAEPLKPSLTMSNGFVTSKIGLAPVPRSTPNAIPPVTPKPHAAKDSRLADHLQVEFIANGASSTLLNAVLNYTVTLTNTSDQDLRDIRLTGEMMQADAETARNGAAQAGDLLHKTESLSAGEAITLSGDIRLPLNAIRPITFKSQALFIPLTRFGVEYADQNNAEHQQAVSFIVGREYEPPRAKMAPFRLDLGPRSFSPVGQRPLNA